MVGRGWLTDGEDGRVAAVVGGWWIIEESVEGI